MQIQVGSYHHAWEIVHHQQQGISEGTVNVWPWMEKGFPRLKRLASRPDLMVFEPWDYLQGTVIPAALRLSPPSVVDTHALSNPSRILIMKEVDGVAAPPRHILDLGWETWFMFPRSPAD